MANEACPDCGGQGIDTGWSGRPTLKCDRCAGTGRVDLVVPAMTADAGPLERGTCKADLTALEHAFRAGYDAALDHADPPGPIHYRGTASEAWAEFLSVEMRALG